MFWKKKVKQPDYTDLMSLVEAVKRLEADLELHRQFIKCFLGHLCLEHLCLSQEEFKYFNETATKEADQIIKQKREEQKRFQQSLCN